MSERTITQTEIMRKPVITPILSGLLQRACACGQHTTSSGGECEECKKKRRGMLQRTAMNNSPSHEIPPTVHEVLQSPGQPLDSATRSFMEPRFGHNFSGVRVHTDAKAAESARAVNALAYTVGDQMCFDTGFHRPDTADGRQLIAHELAHVVQQSGSGIGHQTNETHLEADANRIASAVLEEGIQPMITSGAPPGLQRQPQGGQNTPPAPARPTLQQRRIIDAARRVAAIRCQIAMFRVRGIDPAIEWQLRSRSLARVMFEWNNPNMEQIGDVISSMVGYLTSGVQIMVAPGNDPECGNRAAYVRGLRPPIVLCRNFFNSGPEARIRTMIHEAAHLARIGNAGLAESYCVDFDCQTSCGGFDAADSWAHFALIEWSNTRSTNDNPGSASHRRASTAANTKGYRRPSMTNIRKAADADIRHSLLESNRL
jgi:hypothetical protein